MEKVIDGKRYDTTKAEKIASSTIAADQALERHLEASTGKGKGVGSVIRRTVSMYYQAKSPGAGDLYRTPKGSFFVHERDSNDIVPLSLKEAQGWCQKFELTEVISKHLHQDFEDA